MHFSVYLSPLRGEMSRTKSTGQVLDRFRDIFLDMFLDIFLDIERREETGDSERRQIATIVFYPLFTSGAITDMVAILGTKSLLHNMVK